MNKIEIVKYNNLTYNVYQISARKYTFSFFREGVEKFFKKNILGYAKTHRQIECLSEHQAVAIIKTGGQDLNLI